MKLQKWQRNDVFEAIQAAALDPSHFDLDDVDAGVRIKHRWSESYFVVGGDPGHYNGRYVVGDGPAWPYEVYSWQALTPRISGWLGDVKRDLDTPDLWAELRHDAELLGAASGETTENTPFTQAEREEITERLRALRDHVMSTYSLSEPQMRLLDEKLDYLVEAAGRLGRTDWRGVFVGVMCSWFVSAALPPASALHILITLLHSTGHFYGFPQLPSP